MPVDFRTTAQMFVATLAGVSLVVQSSLYSELRARWLDPSWAAFISYLGGNVILGIFLILTRAKIPSYELGFSD